MWVVKDMSETYQLADLLSDFENIFYLELLENILNRQQSHSDFHRVSLRNGLHSIKLAFKCELNVQLVYTRVWAIKNITFNTLKDTF